jgi:hypothetical protein
VNPRSARGGTSRIIGCTPTGPEPIANAGAVPTASGTTSTASAGHHSAVSLHVGQRMTGTSSNGVAGSASGFTTCFTPSRVAIAAQSRLWRSSSRRTPAGSPSTATAAIAAASSTGSTSQTPPSTASAWHARAIGSPITQVSP